MFGECHGHIFMNGRDYRQAVANHEKGVCQALVRAAFLEYQKHGVAFLRDGGDRLGVSEWARTVAGEYGIVYRTPLFAIHRNHRYGGIVGKGFDTWKEYAALVEEVRRLGGDFIKVMLSGIMDFEKPGVITGTPLEEAEIREMIHIAHESGFAVMAHVNGARQIEAAARWGADSIEHGAYQDEDSIQAMAESGTVWVPTAVTIRNLLGSGRFPDAAIRQIYELHAGSIRQAYQAGVTLALGSDAGAYRVYHGRGILDEYRAFREILSDAPGLDEALAQGEQQIAKRFGACQSSIWKKKVSQ